MEKSRSFPVRSCQQKLFVFFTLLLILPNCCSIYPQTNETNTKYWAQYDNKELGIAFKHPMNWTKRESKKGLMLIAYEDQVGPAQNLQTPTLMISKLFGVDIQKVDDILKNKNFTISKIGKYKTFESHVYFPENGWLTTLIEVERDKTYFIFAIEPYGENEPWGPKMKNIFLKILETVEFY